MTYPLLEEEELPEGVRSHPGMISDEERRLLYGCARDHYLGKGVIVDAGVFLGASTIALGQGLRENPQIVLDDLMPEPIRSFERGIAGPNLSRHTKKAKLPDVPEGESFLGILEEQLKPVQDLTKLTTGDILEYSGEDIDGIEICFLDILKTPEVARHVMEVFFPSLLPGAIIIQQDYFFGGLPFIKVFNEALADKLTYLGEVRSSAIFKTTAPITAADLEDAFAAIDTLDRAVSLHLRAEERTVNPFRQYMMRLSRARLYAGARDTDNASQTLAEANKEFPQIARGGISTSPTSLSMQIEALEEVIDRIRNTEVERAERARKRAEVRRARRKARGIED
ncbi:MAG: hypothetical protein AAF405_09055 [Pseudomonadota bacterium]